VGEKLGFIETTIHYALQRPDLREDLLKYLEQIVQNK
jgi:UTP--glucose-1-phosphate uridylyltransferase